MAYTLAQQYDIANNDTFLKRLQVAIVTVAILVEGEGAGVSGHAARLVFAKQILTNPTTALSSIAFSMVTDGTTDSNTSDTLLLNRVVLLWNFFSGNVA